MYQSSRGELFAALATITDDRDLAVEAIDIGFTRWRRKLRRPSAIAPDVGVMALAYRWAAGQLKKSSRQISGFRLDKSDQQADSAVMDRFRQLSVDERALVVFCEVLGWRDREVAHAVGADGAAAATSALFTRLEADGFAADRFAEALRAHGAGFVEPLSRLQTVKTKSAIQKVGAFVGGAVATVAVVAAGAALLSNIGSSETTTAASPNVNSSIVAGGRLTAENAVWEQIPVPVGSDNITAVAHDGTDFYMLATNNQGRPVMLQSGNGLDWAQLPAPAVGQNMWFQQLVATPGVLMAVGNGFDERNGRETTAVFTSRDNESWSRADLPFEDRIDIDGQAFDLYTFVQSAFASEDGFTIVGNQGAEFDVDQLLRGVVDVSLLRNGWGPTGTGLQFFDNEGRIQETMTWEELGLSPEIGALIGGGRPILWTSEDGIEWESSTTDVPPGTHGIGAYATLDGIDAVLAYGNFAPTVWVRVDGEWEPPDLGATLSAMTVWNDRLVVSGTDNTTGESSIWTTTDGVGWDRNPVPGGMIQQFYPSSTGLVGFGFGINVLGPASIEVDDLSVLAHSDGRLEVLDADGATLLEVFDQQVFNAGTITLTDPDSGEVVVEFDQKELERAWETIYREADRRNDGGPPAFSLMISDDGENWSVLEQQDPNFYPQSVALGNQALLLVGWSEGEGLFGFGSGGMQVILVRPGT